MKTKSTVNKLKKWKMFNSKMNIVCVITAVSFDDALNKARKTFPNANIDGGQPI